MPTGVRGSLRPWIGRYGEREGRQGDRDTLRCSEEISPSRLSTASGHTPGRNCFKLLSGWLREYLATSGALKSAQTEKETDLNGGSPVTMRATTVTVRRCPSNKRKTRLIVERGCWSNLTAHYDTLKYTRSILYHISDKNLLFNIFKNVIHTLAKNVNQSDLSDTLFTFD